MSYQLISIFIYIYNWKRICTLQPQALSWMPITNLLVFNEIMQLLFSFFFVFGNRNFELNLGSILDHLTLLTGEPAFTGSNCKPNGQKVVTTIITRYLQLFVLFVCCICVILSILNKTQYTCRFASKKKRKKKDIRVHL